MRLILIIFLLLLSITSIESQRLHEMAPDIVPITFYAWWGPFNISTLGIFIYYEIINNGSTIYSDTPITLNISILSNSTIIGYITQHPIFFPNIWYKGEKLGGSVFFESSLKPSSIRMIVDYNDSIPERNEDNNEINTSVSQGVIIKGYIIQKGKLCKDRVEIFQVDNESLSYSGFRRYYSNETGYYIATLPPISNLSQTYSLIAYDRVNKTSNLKTSPPLKPGETTMLNFTFSKTPGRPLKPLTLPIAKVDKPHIIIISSRYKTKIDWGDENYSQWITSKVTSHIWHKPGLYRIKIISINDDGMISEWSKPTPLIVVPKY